MGESSVMKDLTIQETRPLVYWKWHKNCEQNLQNSLQISGVEEPHDIAYNPQRSSQNERYKWSAIMGLSS